jgi:hypothetical protein
MMLLTQPLSNWLRLLEGSHKKMAIVFITIISDKVDIKNLQKKLKENL